MKKVYHLSSCSTCKRILKSLDLDDSFVLQDIKHEAITLEQLEEMGDLTGSYEALFSRRSRQYAARNLKEQSLSEEDYKNLILEEYTFLKRPVFVVDGEIFIGNSQKNVEALSLVL